MVNRVLQLMKNNNITALKLTSDLGLSNSTITDWKKGKAKPSAEAAVKLAQYFNVSTDYLLMGNRTDLKSITNEKGRETMAETKEIMMSGENFEIFVNGIDAFFMEREVFNPNGNAMVAFGPVIDGIIQAWLPQKTHIPMKKLIAFKEHSDCPTYDEFKAMLDTYYESCDGFNVAENPPCKALLEKLYELRLLSEPDESYLELTTNEKKDETMEDMKGYRAELKELSDKLGVLYTQCSDHMYNHKPIPQSVLDEMSGLQNKLSTLQEKEFASQEKLNIEQLARQEGITNEDYINSLKSIWELMIKDGYNTELANEFVSSKFGKK